MAKVSADDRIDLYDNAALFHQSKVGWYEWKIKELDRQVTNHRFSGEFSTHEQELIDRRRKAYQSAITYWQTVSDSYQPRF